MEYDEEHWLQSSNNTTSHGEDCECPVDDEDAVCAERPEDSDLFGPPRREVMGELSVLILKGMNNSDMSEEHLLQDNTTSHGNDCELSVDDEASVCAERPEDSDLCGPPHRGFMQDVWIFPQSHKEGQSYKKEGRFWA